jgi:hypothetical protein
VYDVVMAFNRKAFIRGFVKKCPQFLRQKGGINGETKNTRSMMISYERRLIKACGDMGSINVDRVMYKWRTLLNTGVPFQQNSYV